MENRSTEHWNLKIHGKVQGVFFRKSTQRKARELGLVGFVRNEGDGSVYVEVEGEKAKIRTFIEWCQRGPMMAKVSHIHKEKTDTLKGFSEFRIQYT